MSCRLTCWKLLGPSLPKSDRLRCHRATIGSLQVVYVYRICLFLPLAWGSRWSGLLYLIVLITFAHELLLGSLRLVHLVRRCIINRQVTIVVIAAQNVRICFELSFDLGVCVVWSFLGPHLLM